MFDKIISYSIQNKFVIGIMVVALIIWGLFSLRQIPIDALPDITNNQIQVMTLSPTLATQEVEQFITTPVELSLQNIQNLEEIRSISRFGLSVVTVVFEEDMDLFLARQLVSEALKEAEENIPEGLGSPEMAPISTGLGEVYQYVVRPKKGFEDKYSATELRSIQDWIVKRQLSGIEGVVEVNTLGGYLKEYEIAINPNLLKSMGVSISEIYDALQNSNENAGGAYIEKNPNTYYIRTNGIVKSLADIENIVVSVRGDRPILVKNVAKVQFGKAPRYGAMTRNGEEVVGGTVMMLKGENSAAVTERVKKRVIQIQKSLPEGVVIDPYLVRDKLVSTAIGTVKKNLLEGGLIVVFILILMLGNWRAGLIVASVIPLSMLFAVSMMNVFGISANLMSLGAIDFGLIVDGAVIIVEAIVHRLQVGFSGKQLTQSQIDKEVEGASINIRSSAAFGEIIILMVYIPILALVGIEGKMFIPMAQTVMLAIGGALVLSLTYVPMMSALFLSKKISNKRTIADRIIGFFQKIYTPVLKFALRLKGLVVFATILLFAASLFVFSQMGGEFIPTLEEGDLALHQILPPGSSLTQSVETSKIIQKKLLNEFSEVEDVVTKIGSAEIPTDPMPVETGDIIVVMKPKAEWTNARTRQGMFDKMEKSLKEFPGIAYEFSQPIQMRFNELMTGSRADIAIKLYGNDLDLIYAKAKEAEKAIQNIEGIGTTKVEQTTGLPQIIVDFNYSKMAQYGLQVKEINQVVRTAFAGEKVSVVYEEEKRFDMVIRMQENYRNDISDVENLYVPLKNGTQIPLKEVADVQLVDAPMQISRENTNRRIVIGVNCATRDVASLVARIQQVLDKKIDLPVGYYFTYGGQFENLQKANARLSIALPLALGLIFILLFFTFGSIPQAALIFTAIPLSAIGGILALQLRGMPFSISAGIGFIALFGVAVLNGIVLIGYFNQLKNEGMTNIEERIKVGTTVRLRPVLMTALVASLGFLPMAISNSGGAEVQRPLATVVIGGLLTATFLTLIVLPVLYSWLAKWEERKNKNSTSIKSTLVLLPILFFSWNMNSQENTITMEQAVEIALKNHPAIQAANLQIQQSESLKGMKYSPGTTDFSYQGDGLFKENGQRVNQVGLVQNLPNPAKIKAQNALQNGQIVKNKLDKELTEKELKLNVQQVYLDLQKHLELEALYQDNIDLYSKYSEVAEVRTKLGESNKIELLTLQSSLQEFQLLKRQNAFAISNLEQQLMLFLNTNKKINIANKLELRPYSSSENTVSIFVKLAEQKAVKEQANIDILEAKMKPDFNIGYAVQNYYEDGWLHGLNAGVQIPLFNKQSKQKISAQQLQSEVAQANVQLEKLRLKQQQMSLENTILSCQEGVNFYKTQLETIQFELERISKLNYQAGEISYLELLNILGLSVKNRKMYLEQVFGYNETVVLYEYFSN